MPAAAAAAATELSAMATEGATTIPDFTAKAAESYSRLVAQSQQLLSRIYRGEVNPAALQEQMPALLQQRGAEYYLELNRLSYELFTSLLELGRTYRDDLFQAMLPGSPDFRPPARAAAPLRIDDWTQWYQTFNARLVEEQSQAIAQFQVVLRKMAAGELAAETLQNNMRRFVDQRTAEYARQSAELNAKFFDGLMKLNQRSVDDLFRHLAPVGRSGQPRRVETLSLTLVGAIGTTVTASLTVENVETQRSQVSTAISEFRSTDGSGPSFKAACEADPAEFWLEPNEMRTITVRLHLKPDTFAIGHHYAASMLIRGTGEEDILVFIIAGATET
jgi:hypothetical protein